MEHVSTGVLEEIKNIQEKKIKPKYDMMYQDIYNCKCQNTKQLRYTIQYVKPTARLLFKNRFPKGGPTHWGRVMHICFGSLTIISPDNGRRQAIIWTYDGISLIQSVGTNFSNASIEIQTL